MKSVIIKVCCYLSLLIGCISGSVLFYASFCDNEFFRLVLDRVVNISPKLALFVFVVGIGTGMFLRIILDRDG